MMETLQPNLKNGRNVWDKINMPEEEFQRRVRNVKKEMRKQGIDVLLLYGYGLNEYGNYCYLSNFIIRLPRGALMILPLRGEPCLIFEGASRGIPSFRKVTWVDDLRASGDVSKECVKYLKEKNLTNSTIGFVGIFELMPYYQVEFLSESLNKGKILNAEHIIQSLRMVKSQREVDQIHRSSRIIKKLFSFITETKFQNLNEKELEAIIYREARLEGAEDIRLMIARPKESPWAFRPPERIDVLSDETIILNISVEYERYWAEAARTFIYKDYFLKESKAEELEILYNQIVKKMKPDRVISQFYEESIYEIKNKGFSYLNEYGIGQAIGLSPNEFPMIREGETTVFKEGMVFSLKVLVNDNELGARMIGNTICLTKKGGVILTD